MTAKLRWGRLGWPAGTCCGFSVAVLALMVTLFAPQAPLADEQATLRSVTVTGEGRVSAVPDTARLSLGVTTEAEAAGEALANNAEAMTALLASLTAAGIAERDIATAGIGLSPIYSRAEPGRAPQPTGFRASNTLDVRVGALDQLGSVIDEATRAGATNLGAVSLYVAERGALEDEARKAAMADARSRAALYAEAAGARLGAVIAIREGAAVLPGPIALQRGAIAMAAEAAITPVAAGEQEIVVSVTVSFGLE